MQRYFQRRAGERLFDPRQIGERLGGLGVDALVGDGEGFQGAQPVQASASPNAATASSSR